VGGPWQEATLAALEHLPMAVRTFDDEWSGSELLARAASGARVLAAAGSPPGPVPVLVGSTANGVALTLGGALSGRPTAPLGVRLAVAELAPLVQRLGAPALVTDAENAALGADVAEAAGVRHVVFHELPPVELEVVPTTPDSVVVVLHTSGTTGLPKPVPVRDSAVHHRAGAYRRHLGLQHGELYCSAGAFHHTGGVGMCFVAFDCGAAVLPLPRFTLENWRAAADLHPTCGLLVPTMIDMLLEATLLDRVPLRALHYGTAPIHPATLAAALAALPTTRFAQAYGQTEGGPLTMLVHEEHLRALNGEPHLLTSVGRAVEGVDLRIDDPSDEGVGEVVAQAGQVFLPGPDGWLHTGDLGRVDEEDFLYLRGRKGDTIIRGGENVYPLEVERVLETHPDVLEAAVIGVADRRWGETLKAFVVAADPENPPKPADLAAYAAARLARFKVPAEWELTGELPRNAAGKLLRRLLH
jgi:acyl-CoA synthetase (AMP-forming)/AMP-acid ligase II